MDKHVEKQSKRISRSIAMLRKIKPYVPQTTLQTMYKSFVLPYFNYCSTVGFDGNKTHAEKCLNYKRVQHGLLPIRALIKIL